MKNKARKLNKNQFLLVVSGVSGSGKGAVLSILRSYSSRFSFCVSFTTRPPRPKDIPGETYNFVSSDEFEEGIKNDEFIEWEEVHGFKYGRKKKDLEEIFTSGKIPVIEADVKGFLTFKKYYRNVLSIFITSPSLEVAMERLEKRGTESKEEIAKRVERYEMEISFQKRYDHVLVNDDLETAQKELKRIIAGRWQKSKRKFSSKKLASLSLLLSTLFFVTYGSFYLNAHKTKDKTLDIKDTKVEDEVQIDPPIDQNITPQIQPKHQKSKIETTTEKDGTKTTTIATGGIISSQELQRISDSSLQISSPLQIPFNDKTGQYPYLAQILKNYLNNTLKWRGEIGALKEVIIDDYGDIGWTGQYLGQYRTDQTGRIVSATGAILLNVYYYKNSPSFQDYMRMVLAHEYGHHYTLYYKWVSWNLPVGTRFPDSYYQIRPLQKTETAPDYSLGWQRSDLEIIAEDYSYFYSGYPYHAMKDLFGLPSFGIKSWLDNIGDQSLLSNSVVDNPPILEILSPSNGQKVTGTIQFAAKAEDDFGILNVVFLVNGNKIAEAKNSPYIVNIDTTTYSNGEYVLKAVATDGKSSVERLVNVVFENIIVDTTLPTVTVTKPAENPYAWTTGALEIVLNLKDNISVGKLNVYIDSSQTPVHVWEATDSYSEVDLTLKLVSLAKGVYGFRFELIDKSGNKAETFLTVEKT